MQVSLSVREVARILGLSEPRVYQLDAELKPALRVRGSKQKERRYDPAVVERVRAARAARRAPAPLEAACGFCGSSETERLEVPFAGGAYPGCQECREAMGERSPLRFLKHAARVAQHACGMRPAS